MTKASQHSPHRVVRTAATVSALDTTGAREDLVVRLADESRARDDLVRELARAGDAGVGCSVPGQPDDGRDGTP